jgi:hypothetical protein
MATGGRVPKSNRRKKVDRARAASSRAEQDRRRVKAARQQQAAEHYEQLKDPSASPADIAEILAAEFPDRVIAADMLRLRMLLGVPAKEVTETARLAPRLVSWVWRKRADGVLMQNTDGEPMVLIDAAVTVDGDVTERLFARPDFGEEENGEDGQVVWWGDPVDDEEERTVLGRLTPGPGWLRVQVNSRRRLKRLPQILQEIGAVPKVTSESRSEPSLDFAWGPVPGDRLTARQWAQNWIGQPVAVLEFHTPQHAAEGGQADRLRLEGLLRQLEYQSALPAERGGRPADTAWLRAELGLESMTPGGPA